jgi:hypothetical protein
MLIVLSACICASGGGDCWCVQGPLFRSAWAPLIAEHRKAKHSPRCHKVNNTNSNSSIHSALTTFSVIGVHIRLGDVAEKYNLTERAEMAAAPCKRHRWGGKYVPSQMHLSGLDLVWRTIDPACTKVCL